jgi:hypothetical protein
VLEDGFTNIVGLGAPGTPGKLLQALFDGLRKSNGQLVIAVERTKALSCTPARLGRRSMAIIFRKMRFT